MKKRVADILIDLLVKKGITDCFAVVGGGAMHLDNALALNKDMNKWFHHHEQACSMAAEAYARVSGRMAAVCVTSGPGATNAITGVMGAWQDSIPLIVISGQVRYETSVAKTGLNLRYRGTQEFEIIKSVANMTKYSKMIIDPLSIKKEVLKAIDIAMSGRRGPVWLDIPLDIQSALVEEEDLYPYEEKVLEPAISDKDAEELIDLLKNAKRPCLLGGTGIVSSNNQEELIEFLSRVKIPCIGGGWCTDMLYNDHPLYYGLSGNIGPRTGNFILQSADVILVLGNSLSYRQTGFEQDLFAPHAKIIMVDVDEEESKKPGLRLYKFIHSDLGEFFRVMKSKQISMEAPEDWFSYCNMLKNRFSPYEAIGDLDMSERVLSYYFWKVYDEMAPEDQILALGNNSANSARIQIGVRKAHQRAITNYTCGSMGYDLPAAIGVAVATKKDIICITGDGSIMMNLQEIQTIKQNKLPIKIVVFSNDGYNAIRQTCKNFFHGTYIGCTPDTGVSFPDWEKLAYLHDYEYKCCHSNDEVKSCLEWLLNNKGYLFLEIKQKLDNPVTPKVMSRMREDGTFETPALHDMSPFLDKEELEQLILWNK